MSPYLTLSCREELKQTYPLVYFVFLSRFKKRLGWFCCPAFCYFSHINPIKRYVKHALLADVLIFNVRSREFGTSVVIVAVSEVIIIITCRWGRRFCSI